jgi:hypothetical protein
MKVPDVGFDELDEGLSGKERPRQGIDLEGAHNLIIEALAVEADSFQRAKWAMVFVVQAEDDLGRAALEGFPVPVRVCFPVKEIPDADPLLNGQFKRVLPFLVAADHLLQVEQRGHYKKFTPASKAFFSLAES